MHSCMGRTPHHTETCQCLFFELTQAQSLQVTHKCGERHCAGLHRLVMAHGVTHRPLLLSVPCPWKCSELNSTGKHGRKQPCSGPFCPDACRSLQELLEGHAAVRVGRQGMASLSQSAGRAPKCGKQPSAGIQTRKRASKAGEVDSRYRASKLVFTCLRSWMRS